MVCGEVEGANTIRLAAGRAVLRLVRRSVRVGLDVHVERMG